MISGKPRCAAPARSPPGRRRRRVGQRPRPLVAVLPRRSSPPPRRGVEGPAAIRWQQHDPAASPSQVRTTPSRTAGHLPPSESASRRRRSASSARAVGRAPASALVTTATSTRKAPSATQFSSLAIVKRPVGGMWNQLNAAALAIAVPTPSHRPQPVEASSTGEKGTHARRRRPASPRAGRRSRSSPAPQRPPIRRSQRRASADRLGGSSV